MYLLWRIVETSLPRFHGLYFLLDTSGDSFHDWYEWIIMAEVSLLGLWVHKSYCLNWKKNILNLLLFPEFPKLHQLAFSLPPPFFFYHDTLGSQLEIPNSCRFKWMTDLSVLWIREWLQAFTCSLWLTLITFGFITGAI